MGARVAIAGAGIYGATTAIHLARAGHAVELFDPLGILCAASAINQYRVHAGYHYPRSDETIEEIREARSEFISEFGPAIVKTAHSYYAIPREGSRTPPDVYEQTMARHKLALRACRPNWLNYDFIDCCYEVDESVYDAQVLRRLLTDRLTELRVPFHRSRFLRQTRSSFDFVVWATYGLDESRHLFPGASHQVAEKVLIALPEELRHISLVVVDGPFTAFDPYGGSEHSLFGSAKHTNHWSSTDLDASIPEKYAKLLYGSDFVPVPFTRFDAMKEDCCRSVPGAEKARYMGSRFTMRVVESDREADRRILAIREGAPQEFHIFSGKVVGAVKAARLLCERIARG